MDMTSLARADSPSALRASSTDSSSALESLQLSVPSHADDQAQLAERVQELSNRTEQLERQVYELSGQMMTLARQNNTFCRTLPAPMSAQRLLAHVHTLDAQRPAAPMPERPDIAGSHKKLVVPGRDRGGVPIKLGMLTEKDVRRVALLSSEQQSTDLHEVTRFLRHNSKNVYLRVKRTYLPEVTRLGRLKGTIRRKITGNKWRNFREVNGPTLLAVLAGAYGHTELVIALTRTDFRRLSFRGCASFLGIDNRLMSDSTFAFVFHELVMLTERSDSTVSPIVAVQKARDLIGEYFITLPDDLKKIERQVNYLLKPFHMAMIDGDHIFLSECIGTSLGIIAGGVLYAGKLHNEDVQRRATMAGLAIEALQYAVSHAPFCGPTAGLIVRISATAIQQRLLKNANLSESVSVFMGATLVSFNRQRQIYDAELQRQKEAGEPLTTPNVAVPLLIEAHLRQALNLCGFGV